MKHCGLLAAAGVLAIAAALYAQDVAPQLQAAEDARSLTSRMAHATTEERIHGYEEKLRTAPDDPRLISSLASAYLQRLRETVDPRYLDLASKLVERMLEKDGGNFEALRFQNEIDLQRHEFRAVAERSRDMIRYNRSDPGIWGNLGDALMEVGEYDGAREAYTRMFELRPNLGSYNRLAWFSFVTGSADAAIALMAEAIEAGDVSSDEGERGNAAAENTAWCWAELGDMYFKTGKLREAEDAYSKALHLFPSLHRASAGLGKTQAALGDTAAAIRSYQRAQSVVPLAEYAGALEDLFTLAGMPKKAEEQRQLLAVVEKLGTAANEKTNRNLALVLADHNRNLQLALQLVQTEILSRPDVYTWDALSWVLFRNGRLAEAREASSKALRLRTPEPVFYYHAAAIAAAAGDRVAAQDYLDRLTSLNARFDSGKKGEELFLVLNGN